MDVLGLGIQLCKRAKQLFVGLLDDFGGAAAAYSLRKLSRGYSGPLVKVRRDVDNAEKDFTSTTSIAGWVNGKQETTLPADVATASAAYSLRKVKDAYTGNAVRIRRQSDDVEVNVAFDANDEVSTSSAITNVPEEFLSNDFTDGWVEEAGATIVDSNTFTTTGSAQGASLAVANGTKLKITVAGTATGASYRIYDWSDGGIKATLSGTFSTTVEFTTVGNQNKIYFRSTAAGTLDLTSLTIEVINDEGGDTTATTLGAFLTETNTAYESDFSAGTDGWSDNNGFATLTGNQDGIGGRDDVLKVENTAGVARQIRPSNNTAIPYDGTFRLTLDVYRVGGTGVPAYMGAYSGNAGATQNPSVSTEMTEDEWVTLDFGNLTYENYTRFNLFFSASPNSTVVSGVADGGTIYFRNAQVTTSSNNATVHTWYDQAGSNDATQGTAGNQPLLAESGSLLTSENGKVAIEFRRVDSSNGPSLLASSVSGLEGSLSFFVLGSRDATGNIISLSSSTSGAIYFTAQMAVSEFNVNARNTTSVTATATAADAERIGFGVTTGQTSTKSGVDGGSLVEDTSDYGDDFGAGDLDQILIGALRTVAAGGHFDGHIQEFITYTSDQSSNRFKIESNINNHYDNADYDDTRDGFVNTWYDQSGNSKDAVSPADANEPQIVSAGSLVADGIEFDGTDDVLTTSAVSVTASDDLSLFTTFKCSTTSSFRTILSQRGGTGTGRTWIESRSSNYATFIGGSQKNFGATTTDKVLFSLLYDDSDGTIDAFKDGTQSGSQATSVAFEANDGELNIGTTKSFGSPFIGTMEEIIIYTSDQTSNRSDIEDNINSHYSIF